MIDYEGAAPLSDRMMLLVSECELHGMLPPYRIATLAANGSAVVVRFDGGSPEAFTLIAGSVERTGYLAPLHALIVDVRNAALLARIEKEGGYSLLRVPQRARLA
jgi:hypothetical protein